MEHNSVTLSGVITEIKSTRITPAGIPHVGIVIEHRSRQVEAGRPREVTCRMSAELRGEVVKRSQPLLSVGQWVVITGFLDRSGYKDDSGTRTVLHVQTMTSPDTNVGV